MALEDKYVALNLYTSGSKLEPNILQLLRSCKLTDICYAYKIRTKSEQKLLNKLLIKQKEKPNYSLTDITDVVGLRLVALFKSEMIDLLDGVLSAISHNNSINPNPLVLNSIEEIIIYKGNHAFDEINQTLIDTVKKYFKDLTIDEKNSREGYSSIHIVSRLKSDMCIQEQNYSIPIEIQIRTVFEDAWGEIDHKYGYVIRTGKDSGRPIHNPESVLSHLKILKKFTDACNDYADCIHNEAIGTSSTLVSSKKVISVASDQYILDHFVKLKLPSTLLDSYKSARAIKDNASDDNSNKTLFIDAAESFRELADSIDVTINSAHKLFYYYCRMNEAVCLMSTNDKEYVSTALGIYKALIEHYSEFPLLKMRYGQSLSKLGFIDEALLVVKQAGVLFEKHSKDSIGKSAELWPEELPFADYEHIAKALPKLHGYCIWLKIKSLGTNFQQDKFNYFIEAYSATISAVNYVDTNSREALSIHNNLLYYSIGALSRANLSGLNLSISIDNLKSRVDIHINAIESALASGQQRIVSTSDTLMKAYWLLGRKAEASSCADFVISNCLDPTFTDLNNEEKLSLVRISNSVKMDKDFGTVD